MSNSNPSLGWEKLRDVFYRLRECNSLSWDKDISSNIVSISSFGTSIATYPKQSFLDSNLAKSIEVFTGSGVLLYSIPWLESNGVVVSLGWSFDEEYLIVALEQGLLRCYYNFEGDFNEIDLRFNKDQKIRDVQFFSKGCVVKVNDGSFMSVMNYMKRNIQSLQFNIENDKKVFGWIIVPPTFNQTLKVLISTEEGIVSTAADETTILSSTLFFTHLAISPNKEFIALYEDNVLLILTIDLRQVLSNYKSDNTKDPKDIKWCANDAVIIAYSDEIKVVGPTETSINFYYNQAPLIETEQDGLKLLSNDKLEFLSRVSEATISAFKLGSTASSAILIDSIDQLDSHSPKVDENLSIIRSSLVEAIDDCIHSATEEFDLYWQKKLLRAAAFGKSNLEVYNPDFFIEVCDNLKILNNIRNVEVGMFLTYEEYISLGFERLIERLLRRKMYKLSIQISKLLNKPLSSIYIHWGCTEIKKSQSIDDEQIMSKILKKFKKIDQISYSEVSHTAFEEGRLKLSTMLINYEPLPENQIPLLLEMEQDDSALFKAELSGLTDIIQYVLIFLKNKLSLAEFFKLINDKYICLGVFKELFHDDNDILKNFYHQQDDDLRIALSQLSSFYAKTSKNRRQVDEVVAQIAEERKVLVGALRTFDQQSGLTEEVKLLESQIKLLNIRESLTRDFEMDFYNECDSLNSLIVKLISMNQLSKVNKLIAKELKLNDRKMTYLIVDTYIAQKNFTKLYELAKASKSPIGYEYHFKELFKVGEHRQASLYIDMCSVSYETRLKMLLKCNDFKRAAEDLFNKRDIALLKLINGMENSVAKRIARGYLERLGVQED